MERATEYLVECYVRYQDLLTAETRGVVAEDVCLDNCYAHIHAFYTEFYETEAMLLAATEAPEFVLLAQKAANHKLIS